MIFLCVDPQQAVSAEWLKNQIEARYPSTTVEIWTAANQPPPGYLPERSPWIVLFADERLPAACEYLMGLIAAPFADVPPEQRPARPLVLPVALNPAVRNTPRPLQNIRSFNYHETAVPATAALLDHVGAVLGLAICPGLLRIFVAYASRDGAHLAGQIHHELTQTGYDVFLDSEKSLPPGALILEDLLGHLRTASCLLVVDTPGAGNSEWVEQEIVHAHLLNRPVFPVICATQANAVSHLEALRALNTKVNLQIPVGTVPASFTLSADMLRQTRDGMEHLLRAFSEMRTNWSDRVGGEFARCRYDWQSEDALLDLHRSTNLPPCDEIGRRRVLSQCSLYPPDHLPALQAFVGHTNAPVRAGRFQEHLFIHDGAAHDLNRLERFKATHRLPASMRILPLEHIQRVFNPVIVDNLR